MMTPSESFKAHPVMLISNLLVIVGALNWLAVGLLRTDYVTQFAGVVNAKYVFIAVGLAGAYLAYHKVMWFMGKESMIEKMHNSIDMKMPMDMKDNMEHMSGCKTINGNLVCE